MAVQIAELACSSQMQKSAPSFYLSYCSTAFQPLFHPVFIFFLVTLDTSSYFPSLSLYFIPSESSNHHLVRRSWARPTRFLSIITLRNILIPLTLRETTPNVICESRNQAIIILLLHPKPLPQIGNSHKQKLLLFETMLEHIFLLWKLWLAFTIRDLHNQRGKLRRQELAYLTPIQHLFQKLDLWFTSYQLDGYEQLTHLFFAFEPSLDLLAMYPDVLFIDCTHKTNKYNMPLCIFRGVTAWNKSFYIGFAFLQHEDKDSYYWVMTQVKELYIRVG